MKYRFGCVCLALLLALQLCVPVFSAAEEGGLPEDTRAAAVEAALEDHAPGAPDESPAEPGEVTTEWLEPGPGEYGLFQDGAFFGPQTIPSQAVPLSVSEHPGYNAAEQLLYQEIETGLRDHADRISITPFPLASQDRMKEIYYQVVNDHPEMFYCQTGLGWSYNSTSVISITPKYYYSADEAREMKVEFDRCVADALAQIDGVTDTLGKILILHDYLTVTCKYALPIPTWPAPEYSAYGALVDRRAVCQGYSLAFKLLMNEIGVPCVLVEGAESMNHVWNAVQLNGQWYHVDVTWDDPIPDTEGYSGHEYFLQSNASMSGDHYGWDTGLVSPWGAATYDSGWIFNEAKAPVYYWNGSYYYMEAPYTNQINVYKSNSLRGSGAPVRANLNRDYYCGLAWHNGCLYYVPSSGGSTLNVMALDLEKGKTVRLGEFTRSGGEYVGLRCENGGVTVFRSSTGARLGQSGLLPDWFEYKGPYWSYGLSEDGKYVLVDRTAFSQVSAGAGSRVLWAATYNRDGRMTFVGSASSFPSATGVAADFYMMPIQSSGTPSRDQVKVFLLAPATFAPDTYFWVE